MRYSSSSPHVWIVHMEPSRNDAAGPNNAFNLLHHFTLQSPAMGVRSRNCRYQRQLRHLFRHLELLCVTLHPSNIWITLYQRTNVQYLLRDIYSARSKQEELYFCSPVLNNSLDLIPVTAVNNVSGPFELSHLLSRH